MKRENGMLLKASGGWMIANDDMLWLIYYCDNSWTWSEVAVEFCLVIFKASHLMDHLRFLQIQITYTLDVLLKFCLLKPCLCTCKAVLFQWYWSTFSDHRFHVLFIVELHSPRMFIILFINSFILWLLCVLKKDIHEFVVSLKWALSKHLQDEALSSCWHSFWVQTFHYFQH